MSEAPLGTIAEAFSRTAEKYDAFAENHPHLARMRAKVYAALGKRLPVGARVLELNAGTGIDAVQLAKRGYRVHATDISPGMLARLRAKVRAEGLEERVSVQECSFTRLDEARGGLFDAVFSNLGGLNCAADLRPVIRQLPAVLRAGGLVTWVLMPPVCLWELGLVLRGQVKLATRRLARGGVDAHLEGLHFPVYYFPPRQVIEWFGAGYELLGVEGLSVITPTAESKGLALRFPRVYGWLSWLDDRLSPLPPWRGWGDFYILSMRSTAGPEGS